jgi:2-iminobutanoate/2-iminopropanoate deaminase
LKYNPHDLFLFMKTCVQCDSVYPAVGPYSPAVTANGFVFCSGQLPLKVDGSLVGDSIEEQTVQVLENLTLVLESAGSSLSQVVKTTLFLSDMNDFAKVNEIYAKYFPKDAPARATVQVARLPKDVLIEIDAIATEVIKERE